MEWERSGKGAEKVGKGEKRKEESLPTQKALEIQRKWIIKAKKKFDVVRV